MNKLETYLVDGANYQARAVLMLLQGNPYIEESWNEKTKQYDGEINVARWENCREQGYVLMLIKNRKQFNIAFFEHRSSDSIHAVKWIEDITINAPTINTAKFGDEYRNAGDTTFNVSYGHIKEMVDWIKEQFVEFWTED